MISVSGIWKDLIAYHGLTDEDLQVLHNHRYIFEEYGQEIVDAFYDKLNSTPHLVEIVHKHSSVESLKQTQLWYVSTLATDTIDNAYISGRERVGKVHAKIQLSPSWFIGGYSTYFDLILRKLHTLDVENKMQIYDALVRRLVFDSAIIVEQYNNEIVHLTEKLSNFDPLTQIPNRKYFMDRLHEELKHKHPHTVGPAVLFIDLDSFKDVNDSFGHDVGDHVLQTVANRLKECIRSGDAVARLGGDEFTVLLSRPVSIHEAEEVSKRLLDRIQQPIRVGHQELMLTASIGISMYRHGGESPSVLLKRSDLAMYTAKRGGKNRYHVQIS